MRVCMHENVRYSIVGYVGSSRSLHVRHGDEAVKTMLEWCFSERLNVCGVLCVCVLFRCVYF